MEVFKIMLKDNIWSYFFVSFCICGIIEGLKITINNILVFFDNKTVMQIGKIIFGFFPVIFGIVLGLDTAWINEITNVNNCLIHIFVFTGLIYINYYFIFRNIIKRINKKIGDA